MFKLHAAGSVLLPPVKTRRSETGVGAGCGEIVRPAADCYFCRLNDVSEFTALDGNSCPFPEIVDETDVPIQHWNIVDRIAALNRDKPALQLQSSLYCYRIVITLPFIYTRGVVIALIVSYALTVNSSGKENNNKQKYS